MKAVGACVALWALSLPCFGQEASFDGGTAPPTPEGARLGELERKVEILSAELESQRMGVTPVPSAGMPEVFGMSPAASKVYTVQSGLSIGGYGETILSGYATHLQNGTRNPEDTTTDYLRGVLYVGYKFNDWLVFNSEYEWEHSGFSDEHAEGEAIVEFGYLDFLLSKAVSIRAGQVLLPVGLINELHEPPIFLGALRPALEQENGIIPTTWHENGVGIHGDLPGNLSYKLYVVNGLDASKFNGDGTGSIGTGRQDGHLAIANEPAFTGRLDWHPVPGTFVGGSFYEGNSAQLRGSPSVWTTLVEVHGEYRAHGFQARGIYAYLSNSRAGVEALDATSGANGVGTTQSGGYVEAGYDVFALTGILAQSLIPFVRCERFNLQQTVRSGATVTGENDRTSIEMGANYKPIPQVAIKADFDVNTNGASSGRDQLNLALAYLF